MTGVSSDRRFTRSTPCPICGGCESDPRGHGKRCVGFISADRLYVHCSREEHAGSIAKSKSGCYPHRLDGDCRCGQRHDGGSARDDAAGPYNYRDERGALLYQVVRKTNPKRFSQRKPDGNGGWIFTLGDVQRVPYRLPELLAADPSLPVYIVEGEKDALTLVALGLVATTNAQGAEKFHTIADRSCFAGRDVIVVGDNDATGRRHVAHVERLLRDVARSVRIMMPPNPHKDVTDLIEAGGSLADLVAYEGDPAADGPLFDGVAAANDNEPRTPADDDTAPGAVLVGLAPKIAALGTTGPRLTTGFPTFDAACRGGLPMQRVIVVGGAPGAAKTTTAAQWALRWATQGVPVAFLAADEEAGGILVRWGQACGLALDDLEQGSDATKVRLAAELEGLPLDLVDSEDADEAITIERVSTELAAKRGGGRASVLIVDSIQMAKANGTESIDSPRERIDAVVKALKRAAKRDGHLVIVTSELARAAYRGDNEINPLAAFKESGSIEYGVGTALVLRTVDGEPGLIDVSIPKNRIGRSADAKRPFRMRLDFARATLTETDLPAQARTDPAGRAEALEEAVYRVTDRQALYSKDAIYAALKDEGSATRKATVTSLLQAMIDDGRLSWGGKGSRIARPLTLSVS